MIKLTFPDNSVREFPAGVTGRDIAEGISKSLAKKAVAMALDGALADLADPIETGRGDRDRHPRRPAGAGADPPRRRARHGGGGAGALSRHAGDHRAGDRERLLLRFLPQPAVHHRGSAEDRGEDARDHPARPRPSPRRCGRARIPSACSPTWARCSRSSWSTRSPPTSRSKSTGRAIGSTSAAGRTWSRPGRSARRSS